MAAPRQNTTFQDDSDSDSVSITSTVASEPQEEYEVETILAEEEGDDGIDYLIKWEGYPLHRCTWEPESNLYNKSILQDWTEKKMRITKGHAKHIKNFDQFNRKNIQAFEDAVVEFEEAKEQRKKKRRAKRIKLGLPVNPENEEPENDQEMGEAEGETDDEAAGEAAGEADETDDHIPLVPKQRKKASCDLTRFITDDEELKEASMIAGEIGKTPPEQLSEDSLMEELTQMSSKKISPPTKPLRSQSAKDILKERTSKVDSSSRKPSEKTTGATEGVSRKINRQLEPPDAAPSQRAPPHSITNAFTSAQVTNSGISGSKTSKPATTTMKRTGITMNMSKTPGPKRQWRAGSGAFKTLKMIRRAELRGRNERVPDPKDLEFVDTHSGSTSRKKSSAIIESNNPSASKRVTRHATDEAEGPGALNLGRLNPYSLRYFEDSNREDNMHGFDDSSVPPDVAPDSTSVAVEHSDKVPMTCFNWKNGSCQYNAQQCRFLHQLTDLTGPADGSIPPKFLRPPLTCHFWFFQGCNKTDAECKYAHWNTGLVAQLYNKLPLPVDKSIVPPHLQAQSKDQDISQPTFTTFDKGVTCYYWHKGYCRKSESECMFAHRNTGQVATPRGTLNRPNLLSADIQHNQKSEPVRHPLAQDTVEIPQQPAPPPPSSPPPPPPPLSVANTMAPQAHPINFVTGASMSAGELQDSFIPDAIKVFLVLPGNDGHEIEVQLAGFDYTAREKLRSLVRSDPRFEVKYACHPNDWKEICHQDLLSSTLAIGDIIPVPSSSVELEAYTQYLRMDSSGSVIHYNQVTMIIYPAQQESWNFLNAGAHLNSTHHHLSKLHIHIRSSVSSPINNNAPMLMLDDKASIKDMKAMLRVNLGIEPDRLFEWPEQSLERRAFLMFDPEEHREELELVTRFLQLERVKIYHSGVPGSWEYFRKHCRSGVILFHPDIYHYWEIPNLRYFLGHSINFFQLGCDPWAASAGLEYTCTRLFPSGSVIFITDDVFVHTPGLAFALVKIFVKEKFENVPQGSRTWKLAARPGLVPWILELAEDHHHEIMAGRERDEISRIKLYEKLSELVPPELQDPMDPPNPSEDSSLVSASPKDLPYYHSLWKQDERRATDFMVNWFAGWACSQVTKYRRFVVVHPMKKPEWTDRYSHILDVATPEECIRLYLEPKSKK